MWCGYKQQFYTQFLGWVETNGLRGTRYTDPVVKDLRRRAQHRTNTPKLTLQVGRKEIKLSQDVQDEKNRAKKRNTIKFLVVPSTDVTFVHQARSPINDFPDDVVACIYLGYVPQTQRYVHVHVYRFDSPDTATTFTKMLDQIISMNVDRTAEIERQLIKQGVIEDVRERVVPVTAHVRSNKHRFDSSGGMGDKAVYKVSDANSESFSDEGFPSVSDEIEPDLQSLRDSVPFDLVTEELKTRLRLTETQGAAPLLLPPKDYDTVVRRHGNVSKASTRKCLQIPIVGSKSRHTSEESGVEVPSLSSSKENQNSADVSNDKVSSAYSSINDISSPPTSPSAFYPQSPSQKHPLTQRNSYSYGQLRTTGPASSAAISNRSSVSIPVIESRAAVIYIGKTRVADVPSADYNNATAILKQKTAMHSNRDLTERTPTAVIQREIDYGYAVLPKRYERHSVVSGYQEISQPPRVIFDYEQNARVRRANSLYR